MQEHALIDFPKFGSAHVAIFWDFEKRSDPFVVSCRCRLGRHPHPFPSTEKLDQVTTVASRGLSFVCIRGRGDADAALKVAGNHNHRQSIGRVRLHVGRAVALEACRRSKSDVTVRRAREKKAHSFNPFLCVSFALR